MKMHSIQATNVTISIHGILAVIFLTLYITIGAIQQGYHTEYIWAHVDIMTCTVKILSAYTKLAAWILCCLATTCSLKKKNLMITRYKINQDSETYLISENHGFHF